MLSISVAEWYVIRVGISIVGRNKGTKRKARNCTEYKGKFLKVYYKLREYIPNVSLPLTDKFCGQNIEC